MITDELSPPFRQLAQHMAQNHVYLSVKNEDFPDVARHLLNDDLDSTPPKIVVVVGAGASNDACNLPTGEHAAKHLTDAFILKARVSRQLIVQEIRRITIEYRLDRDDFEAVLLALSKFDQATVLDELNSMYSRRHYPSLTYEVLAHWLKHRFIDAIINFNFDELLDQAIDDELGAHGYYRVITDGDCQEDIARWRDERDRFRFPLYIKPHGTASHKSTMRFTRSSYSLLAPELVNLLVNLFDKEVDVIVLGHAMQSVEFNDILARNKGEGLHFYALGHQKPELRDPNGPDWHLDFCCTTPTAGLSDYINLLATEIATSFRKG